MNNSVSNNIFNSGYNTFTPPADFNTPYSIKCKCIAFEPQINVKTSWRFLKEFTPTSSAMQKAKEYWLNYKPALEHPEIKEKSPEQISTDIDFLNNVEFLKVEVWKWHVCVVMEDIITCQYHRSALRINQEKGLPEHLFSKVATINRANKNILDPLEIPVSFLSIKEYEHLEPKDLDFLIINLNRFPEISKGIKYAKKYWSKDVTKDEAQKIINEYPDDVQKFRELIWKRHLSLDGSRELEHKYSEELINNSKKSNENCLIGIACTIIILATIYFSDSK